MSTQEVKNESEQKGEYPSRKSHQEAEAKTKVLFSTEKLCFQPRMQVLSTIQDVLRRSNESFEDEGQVYQAHCMQCERAGFVSGVPA